MILIKGSKMPSEYHEKKETFNLLIIEDHLITAQLLKLQIEKVTNFIVFDILINRNDILNYDRYEEIDVVISDYLLSDTNGCEIFNHIMKINPNTKIIVLSGYSDINIIQNCFKKGIHGFISKKSSINNVINSINCVCNGGNYICNQIVLSLFDNNLKNINSKSDLKKINSIKSALTKREEQILELIAEGKKNSGIANELFISERTVETHRRNIMKKFGQDNIITVIKNWLNMRSIN